MNTPANPRTDAGWSLLQLQMAVRTFLRADAAHEAAQGTPAAAAAAEAGEQAAADLERILTERGTITPEHGACTFEVNDVWATVVPEHGQPFGVDREGNVVVMPE